MISNTAAHSTEDSGALSLSLSAGSSYNIKLEYYNYSGPAFTQLQYSATGLTKQVVPTASTLYDLTTTSSYTAGVPNTTAPVASTFTGAPAGWGGGGYRAALYRGQQQLFRRGLYGERGRIASGGHE